MSTVSLDSYRFFWERVWRSAYGPADAQIQHGRKTYNAKASTLCNVLGALAMYMDPDGSRCQPSLSTLMVNTKLGRDTLVVYLAWGHSLGWFKRVRWTERRATGAVERVRYDPQIPHGALDSYLKQERLMSGQIEMVPPPPPQSDRPIAAGGAESDYPTAAGGGAVGLSDRGGGGAESDYPTEVVERGRIVRGARSDSPGGAVGLSDLTNQLPTNNQPDGEEEGGRPPPLDLAATATADPMSTPVPAASLDPLTPEEAQSRMWAYLDASGLRELHPTPAKWFAFRQSHAQFVAGLRPQQWWCEKRREHITDWRERLMLWEQAVDAFALDQVQPDRKPEWRSISELLYRIIIPQTFDRFRQYVARDAEPQPGTEHAGAQARGETPGGARVQHGGGSGMSLIDVRPPAFPEDRVNAWAERNRSRAAPLEAEAAREAGFDPAKVAAGEQNPETSNKYRTLRLASLQRAMIAAGEAVNPASAATFAAGAAT